MVFVNPEDIAELGLTDGCTVDLVGEWEDGVKRVAEGFRVVGYLDRTWPRRGSYYPETNVLVPLGQHGGDVENRHRRRNR